MRLNRRGLGTGLLASRIVPAGLLLVTAGAAALDLSLSRHPPNPAAGASALWRDFTRPSRRPGAKSLRAPSPDV